MDNERYFEALETDLDEAFDVARRARERGGDPTEDVEIPVARDMADRVENILGGIAAALAGPAGDVERLVQVGL